MTDVLISTEGALGRITLNRPQALNALTLAMVRAIGDALAIWHTDASIQQILIDGAGERGFCAGGDIRAVYQSVRAGTTDGVDFFRAEYRLNAQIAEYTKPIVALMDGIVMGGGIGLSAHASHRVVTERSILAMPETGIGFIPDIGATYLLSRPELGELGTHIALAAPRLNADDALAASLADYVLASESLADLPGILRHCASAADISQMLIALATSPPDGTLRNAREWIDACYGGNDIETILARLEEHPEPAAQQAAHEIRAKSPISLKQTLHMLRHARSLSNLRDCLEIEFRTAAQIIKMPDFAEGVRAAVIDKDRKPKWSTALEDVTREKLDEMFPETQEKLFE